MSWLSSAVGKIPLVGHGLNEVGKFLPSGGQLIGNVLGGPVGTVLGGAIDGNTTPIQKTIGNTVAAAAGTLGAGSALAGIPGLSGLEGAIAKIPGGSEILAAVKSGAAHAGDLLGFLKDHSGDLLAAVNVYEAAQRQGKADKYANLAFDTANNAYNAKAPLRMAGIEGMLHPQTPDISGLRSLATARSGNPFARGLPMAAPPMAGGATPIPPVAPSGAAPGLPMTPTAPRTTPTGTNGPRLSMPL